jgi:purine-binding chemotaxis protein CheW
MTAPDGPFILFRLDEAVFALPAAAVAEILPLPNLDRPPGSPAVLAGFMNLGGEPLAVADLAVVLDAGTEADPQDVYRHVLRLASGDLGLLVDRVTNLAVTATVAAQVDPKDSVGGAVVARLTVAGTFATLLDPARLLLAEETLRFEALADAARKRLTDVTAQEA